MQKKITLKLPIQGVFIELELITIENIVRRGQGERIKEWLCDKDDA